MRKERGRLPSRPTGIDSAQYAGCPVRPAQWLRRLRTNAIRTHAFGSKDVRSGAGITPVAGLARNGNASHPCVERQALCKWSSSQTGSSLESRMVKLRSRSKFDRCLGRVESRTSPPVKTGCMVVRWI
jgi:hypothetical protein